MLGNILAGLTNAAAAEAMLEAVGDDALLARVRHAAGENGLPPGAYVAATVRHLLDHGDEELWLGLVGKMANSPQPGAAALHAMLAHAFPATSAACCNHEAPGLGHRHGHGGHSSP